MSTNGRNPDHFSDEEIDESELDINYADIEEKYRPKFQDTFDNLIVVHGAPIVDQSKRDRLLKAIVSTFAKKKIHISDSKIEMPQDEDGLSKGYLFIELDHPEDADRAVRNLHDYPFDKKHRFTVIRFTEVERYSHVPDVFVPPVLEEYKPRGHLKSWLADPQNRDQMILYQGEDVKVAWHGRNGVPEVAHKRTKWTEAYTAWSHEGTILATVHNQGVALWGGHNFDRIHRLYHPKVKLIDFSPMENYLVTWSDQPIELSNDPQAPPIFTEDDQGHSIAVWEVMTGKLLRTFPVLNDQTTEDGARIKFQWPMFKWSGDDRYLARITPGQAISVYETPGMGLLEKKSIKIEGVVDFEWCPLGEKEREAVLEAQKLVEEPAGQKNGASEAAPKKKGTEQPNMMAYWTPEVANQPARVSLMALPSRDTLRSKNLFNVHDAKIHWQSNGDYLCVKVDRHTKTKKTTYCNLELFRVRDKSFPVDVIEIKDTVTAFAWEPKGNRFVLITTSDPSVSQGPVPGQTIKTSVHFYGIDPKKGEFRLLKSFDGKSCNSVYWSPKGRHVITATMESTSKFDLEFWDTDLDDSEKELGSGIQLLASVEHYGMTEIQWDPSGRYVATLGSIWVNSMEPGYAIWDFKGEQLHKAQLERFKQLLWRPRPRSLLSKEAQRKIRKNFREYSKLLEEEDQLEASNVSAELIAHRRRLLDEWDAWRLSSKRELLLDQEELGKLPIEKSVDQRDDVEQIQEWIEEVIEETETVIG
ncbi:eukaryotic translation initiation factor 3 subunit 9 [Melampsora americana]|nr:eukaryotic translation initiation factor 3 subunit 9 [Melampsora americana]